VIREILMSPQPMRTGAGRVNHNDTRFFAAACPCVITLADGERLTDK
jgi:hypothetical protein